MQKCKSLRQKTQPVTPIKRPSSCKKTEKINFYQDSIEKKKVCNRLKELKLHKELFEGFSEEEIIELGVDLPARQKNEQKVEENI